MRAHAAMGERFGRPMDYLRVDLLRWEDAWVVSELELIEPGLYLDVSPANAGPFATWSSPDWVASATVPTAHMVISGY